MRKKAFPYANFVACVGITGGTCEHTQYVTSLSPARVPELRPWSQAHAYANSPAQGDQEDRVRAARTPP